MPSPLDHVVEALPDGAAPKPGATVVTLDAATGKVTGGIGFFKTKVRYGVVHDRRVTIAFPVELRERRTNTAIRVQVRVDVSLSPEPDATHRRQGAERIAEAFDREARVGGTRVSPEEAIRTKVWRTLYARVSDADDAPALQRLVYAIADTGRQVEGEVKSALERAFLLAANVVLEAPGIVSPEPFEVTTARFSVVTMDLPDREFSQSVAARIGPMEGDRLRVAQPFDMDGWRALIEKATRAAYREHVTAYDHVFSRDDVVRRVVSAQVAAELRPMGRDLRSLVIEHDDPPFPRQVSVAVDVPFQDRYGQTLGFRAEVNLEHTRDAVRRFLQRGKPEPGKLVETAARAAITRAMQGKDFTLLGEKRQRDDLRDTVEKTISEALKEAGLDGATVLLTSGHSSTNWLYDTNIVIPRAEYQLKSTEFKAELSFDVRVRFNSLDRLRDWLVPHDRLADVIRDACASEIAIVFRGTTLPRYLGYLEDIETAGGLRFSRDGGDVIVKTIREAIEKSIRDRIGDVAPIDVQPTPYDTAIQAAIHEIARMPGVTIVSKVAVPHGDQGLRNVTIASAWRLQPPSQGETFAAYLTRRAGTFDAGAFERDLANWVTTQLNQWSYADLMNIHVGAPGSGDMGRKDGRSSVGAVLRKAVEHACIQAYGLALVVDWVTRELSVEERNTADIEDVRHLAVRRALDETFGAYERAAKRHLRDENASDARVDIIDAKIRALIEDNPRAVDGSEYQQLMRARAAEVAARDAAARGATFLPPSEGRSAVTDQSNAAPPRDDPAGGGSAPRGRGGP
jgi:hypothetical protein